MSRKDIIYDSDDNDSVISEDIEIFNLPLGWSQAVHDINDILQKVVLTYGGRNGTHVFVQGVRDSRELLIRQYGSEWRNSGIVFRVRSVNILAERAEDQVQDLNARIPENLLESPDLYGILEQHIDECTAPVFVHLGIDEISDSLIGTYIDWNVNKVTFWFEKIPKNDKQLTVITGEEEIHPGIFTKKINFENHVGVYYNSTDCIFVCLNEVTKLMLSPEDIKSEIWPSCSLYDISKKVVHTRRHVEYVCNKFDVDLGIYDVEKKKWIGYNKGGLFHVDVVKVGLMVGILDRIQEREVSEESFGVKYLYAYYDLETVQSSRDKFQRIYAYSFKSSRVNETICYHDVDVVEKTFVETVKKYLSETKGITTYLFAWNGSRFDSRIIVPLLRKNELWIGNVIVNGANELLSATIKYGSTSGTVILRDPCKLLPSTLSEAATTLRVDLPKGEINHNDIEQAYINETLCEYMKSNGNKIKSYVRDDVLILEQIVLAIKDLYKIEIDGKKIPFATCFSRSMAAAMLWNKIHNDSTRELLMMLPQGPYDIVNVSGPKLHLIDVMSHILAARVQTPYGKTYHDDVILIDAKSMYPSQAALKKYPCGSMISSEKFMHGKLGIYEVVIKFQNYPHVIPYRKDRLDAYDWNSNGEITKWITSVDVEELLENGAVYNIKRGVYWTSSTDKYFKSYMETLYKLRRMENDVALNLHYKILMNALLGGLIQDQLREYSVILTNDELKNMQKKYSSVISVIEVHDYEEGHLLCVFKPIKLSGRDANLVNLQQEICKSAIVHKPGILTWFVLAYSRQELRRVWRLIENESEDCRMIYCDTDSLMFTNTLYAKSRMQEYNLLGKDLGQWDIEMENAEAYIIRSKFYALRCANGDKVRIKGVKKSSYCRTDETDASVTVESLTKIINSNSFDNKSVIFKEIVEYAKNKSLGPSFENVRDVYYGSRLRVVNFQMHKDMGGIMKKYIVSEFKK